MVFLVFLCTGGYEYPAPPPYSYGETATIEQPGKCQGTVFLIIFMVLHANKSEMFLVLKSTQKMEFSDTTTPLLEEAGKFP